VFTTTTKTEGPFAALLALEKHIRFAAVATATAVVKIAQGVVIEKIKETFVTRSEWFAPTNYYGIHFKPATLDDPTAELETHAYWLVPHELGAIKQAHDGQFLAIPSKELQPDIHQAIKPNERPRNLENAFILQTARGPKLFQRINHQIRLAYNLVRSVKVRKQSTVIAPTVEVAQTRFAPIFAEKLKEAIKTAK